MRSNFFDDKGAENLAESLHENFHDLEVFFLYLRGNDIGDEGVHKIFEAISSFYNIHEISVNLDSNNIGSQGVNYISKKYFI